MFGLGSVAVDSRVLTCTTFAIFKQRNFLSAFKIPSATLVRFLVRVEDLYRGEVSYHNRYHAADVTQSTHYLLNSEKLSAVMHPIELFAAVFASAVHDVDHPGLTNQYLINTSHDLVSGVIFIKLLFAANGIVAIFKNSKMGFE